MAMSPEGLAALKIDRTQKRAARRNGRLITFVIVVVAIVALFALVAPKFQAATVSVAPAETELAASKAPLATTDAQIVEINIKLAEAQRKYKRDKECAERSAMPMSNAEDREFEIKAAAAEIETTNRRRQEIEKRIAV